MSSPVGWSVSPGRAGAAHPRICCSQRTHLRPLNCQQRPRRQRRRSSACAAGAVIRYRPARAPAEVGRRSTAAIGAGSQSIERGPVNPGHPSLRSPGPSFVTSVVPLHRSTGLRLRRSGSNGHPTVVSRDVFVRSHPTRSIAPPCSQGGASGRWDGIGACLSHPVDANHREFGG